MEGTTAEGFNEKEICAVIDASVSDNWDEWSDGDTNGEGVWDSNYQVQKTLQKVIKISTALRKSPFYSELKQKAGSVGFRRELTRFMGSHSEVVMVIYGLGGLETRNSMLQLAVALLLKEDLWDWISSIEVYDPVHSETDVEVLKRLGCTLLEVDECCRRRAERPTLFFLPSLPLELCSNLLQANWSPSYVKHVMILMNQMSCRLNAYRASLERGESFGISSEDEMECDMRVAYIRAIQSSRDRLRKGTHYLSESLMKKVRYLEAVEGYVNEIGIGSIGSMLYGFAFHFFDVPVGIDMETLLKGEVEIEEQMKKQYELLEEKETKQMVAVIDELILDELDELLESEDARDTDPVESELRYGGESSPVSAVALDSSFCPHTGKAKMDPPGRNM